MDTAEELLPPAKRKKRAFHPIHLLILALALVCGAVHALSLFSAPFADFWNRHISGFFRFVLAKLTGWIPFSLAETGLLFLPALTVLLIVHAVRVSRTRRTTVHYLLSLLCALAVVYILFVSTFATGYNGSRIDKKLSMARRDVSAMELYGTATWLSAKMDALLPEIEFRYGASSVMPYTLAEMNEKLNDAYACASEKYPFLQSFRSSVKHIALSEPMTYTHISGVYTFFTGEANLNTNFPTYVLAFTEAHEMAHQRGIAREDEANFVAFLVCTESEDPYLRYSGYLNVYEYVMNALSGASSELYAAARAVLDPQIYGEMRAYSAHFEKYRNSTASKVSGAVNDSYLTMVGTEGTKSYGMVVDLVVLYAEKHANA